MSHDFPDGPDWNPEPIDDDPWDAPEAHPEPPERILNVVPCGDDDVCPLCGIHCKHAGYLRETCGDGYLQPGCFIQAPSASTSADFPRTDA